MGMLLFLRETYAPRILGLKAARLRKSTGNMNWKSKLDRGISPGMLLKITIVRPMKMLFFSPIVFFLSLYMVRRNLRTHLRDNRTYNTLRQSFTAIFTCCSLR